MSNFELKKSEIDLYNDPAVKDGFKTKTPPTPPPVSKMFQTKIKACVKTPKFTIACIVTTLFVCLVGMGAIFGISWGASGASSRNSRPNLDSGQYTPGDTRILSFSSFFCTSANVEVQESVNASAYLIDSPPPLSENRTVFSFSHTRVYRPLEYQYWQYYLLPGSHINVLVCTDELPARLYIVKGTENASTAAYDRARGFAYLLGVSARRYIGAGKCRDFNYRVTEGDEYFILVDNDNSSFSSVIGANVKITRTHYQIPSDQDKSVSCKSTPSSNGKVSCTVDIPYSGALSRQSVLMAVSMPTDVDWTEGVDVSISCTRRDWAYAVVVVFPLIAVFCIIAVVVLSVVACCKCYIKKLKAEYV